MSKKIKLEDIEKHGVLLDSNSTNTCQLWQYKNEEYVVKEDDSIITHSRDMRNKKTIFA